MKNHQGLCRRECRRDAAGLPAWRYAMLGSLTAVSMAVYASESSFAAQPERSQNASTEVERTKEESVTVPTGKNAKKGIIYLRAGFEAGNLSDGDWHKPAKGHWSIIVPGHYWRISSKGSAVGKYCVTLTLPVHLKRGSHSGNQDCGIAFAQKFKRSVPLTNRKSFYVSFYQKYDPSWKFGINDPHHKAIILEESYPRLFMNFNSKNKNQSRIAFYSQADQTGGNGSGSFYYFNQPGKEPYVENDGKWHHYQMFIDKPARTVKIWFDGKLHFSRTDIDLGTNSVDYIYTGAYRNGEMLSAGTMSLDDVVISDHWIKPILGSPSE